MADKYQVTDLDGDRITRLNQRLATKQGVTDDELHALRASHQLRFYLFQIANANKDHPLTLQMLARLFSNLESEQQELWHFGADLNFQRFFDLPGCTCPRMDNEERLGTPYKIHNTTCPIHGDTHEPFL